MVFRNAKNEPNADWNFFPLLPFFFYVHCHDNLGVMFGITGVIPYIQHEL